jgi:TPR repeat protein
MSKGQLRVVAVILALGMIMAALLMMPRQRRLPTTRAETAIGLAPKTPVDIPTRQSGIPRPQTTVPARLPARPSANTASRNARRSGFAWILRQLGASEELLDRLVDGDLAASLKQLNQLAAKGDPTAIDILGFIAYQKCYLGRSEEQIGGYEAMQLKSAGDLARADADWFTTVVRQEDAYDRQFASVCSQLIDQDQVASWVSARATQGDGASLWLLSLTSSHLGESQQRLRDAAAAGFPEAQFELAWAILSGQQGAAGNGPNADTAESLLRQASDRLPRAEANLSVCEYWGCQGAAPDTMAAVTHARDAAQKGAFDAMIALGPYLSAGQVSPDEVAAWNLVHSLLQQSGCQVSTLNVEWMKSTGATLSATNMSANALALANRYWQDFGTQMKANLGCGS